MKISEYTHEDDDGDSFTITSYVTGAIGLTFDSAAAAVNLNRTAVTALKVFLTEWEERTTPAPPTPEPFAGLVPEESDAAKAAVSLSEALAGLNKTIGDCMNAAAEVQRERIVHATRGFEVLADALRAPKVVSLHQSPQALTPPAFDPELMCSRFAPMGAHLYSRCTMCGHLWASHRVFVSCTQERPEGVPDYAYCTLCGDRWGKHGGPQPDPEPHDVGHPDECTEAQP
jgi:hypothetical protein